MSDDIPLLRRRRPLAATSSSVMESMEIEEELPSVRNPSSILPKGPSMKWAATGAAAGTAIALSGAAYDVYKTKKYRDLLLNKYNAMVDTMMKSEWIGDEEVKNLREDRKVVDGLSPLWNNKDLVTLEEKYFNMLENYKYFNKIDAYTHAATEKDKLMEYWNDIQPPIGGNIFNYQHLGPGNTIELSTKNTLDGIAKAHDIAYSNAVKEKDIHDADQQFIDNTNKVYEDSNLDFSQRALAKLSGMAISAKQAVEQKVGVLYPAMKPKPVNPFGNNRNGTPITPVQWLFGLKRAAQNKKFKTQAETLKYLRGRHELIRNTLGKEEYDKIFNKYPNQFNLNNQGNSLTTTTTESPPNIENIDLSMFDEPMEPVAGSSSMGVVPEPASKKAKTGETGEQQVMPENNNMEVAENVEGAAGGANSGGSGIAVQALQYYRSPASLSLSIPVVYKNSFRTRTWGSGIFPKNFPDARTATNLGGLCFVMPYAAFPVEKLNSFIPEAVFRKLQSSPAIYKVLGIKVKVTPIGQMVSFNANTSASGVGTTSHTLYGSSGIGLNKKLPTLYAENIRRDEQKPMVISNCDIATNPDWSDFLWGVKRSTKPDEASQPETVRNLQSSMCGNAIFEAPTFLSVFQGSAEFDAGATYTPSYSLTVNNSMQAMTKYITSYPMQPHTGIPCINYEYICQQGSRLTNTSLCWRYIDYSDARRVVQTNRQSFEIAQHEATGVGGTSSSVTTGGYNNQMAKRSNIANLQQFIPALSSGIYKDFVIEDNNYFTHRNAQDELKSIPQIFFGIEAVRSNTPGQNTEFVNASCDFYVETEIAFIGEDFVEYPNDDRRLPVTMGDGLLYNNSGKPDDKTKFYFPTRNGMYTSRKTY